MIYLFVTHYAHLWYHNGIFMLYAKHTDFHATVLPTPTKVSLYAYQIET